MAEDYHSRAVSGEKGGTRAAIRNDQQQLGKMPRESNPENLGWVESKKAGNIDRK